MKKTENHSIRNPRSLRHRFQPAFVALLWLSAFGLAGCGTDESFSEYERTRAAFLSSLGGEVSSLQWWRTAVTLKVDVRSNVPVNLWALSAEKGGTLYACSSLPSSGTALLTVPQDGSHRVVLIHESNRKLTPVNVNLTGRITEPVDLEIQADGKAQAPAVQREADRSSLYGHSVADNANHYELTPEQMSDYENMIQKVMQEGVNAREVLGLNCDYELESNGPFDITMVAGRCMSSSAHVFGYYVHSPGTYDDIRYVDLTEIELIDYIDGLAKVQYQVDATAAARFGLEQNRWYDANFDMYDLFDRNPIVTARQGDDAYNTMAVFSRYSGGENGNVSSLRGVSFRIDVPAGMRVGFYERRENVSAPEQYDRLVSLGIKPYTSRDLFKGTSFSAEAINIENPNGNFRSFVERHPHTIWMGMENDCNGGDLDCNDVIFGVTADLEIHRPDIVEPDIREPVDYASLFPWIIAFEDVFRQADFDFNDAVIKILPNPEKETCRVWVMAAGSPERMYLHYDGPDGDVNLGEIHALLGGAPGTFINTTNSMASVAFAEVGEVAWSAGYDVATDASRFHIEVQRGTCTDCTDLLALPSEPGQMPEALLVAGEWKWPLEGTHIQSAYRIFPLWAKDCTKVNYWNWYNVSQSGQVVSY